MVDVGMTQGVYILTWLRCWVVWLVVKRCWCSSHPLTSSGGWHRHYSRHRGPSCCYWCCWLTRSGSQVSDGGSTNVASWAPTHTPRATSDPLTPLGQPTGNTPSTHDAWHCLSPTRYIIHTTVHHALHYTWKQKRKVITSNHKVHNNNIHIIERCCCIMKGNINVLKGIQWCLNMLKVWKI